MNVRHVLMTVNSPHTTLVFVDGSQRGCPRTDYVDWYSGDETRYDEREVSSVVYGDDRVEIRLR